MLAIEPSTIKLPPSTVVIPVFVLVPVRVKVPVPTLSRARVLLNPSCSIPAKLVLVLSVPTVSVAFDGTSLEPPLLVTSPEPLNEPSVLLKPFRSSVAPALTVKAEPALKAPGEPACKTPVVTVVVPVYVFVPVSVSVLPPSLTTLPVPLIAPPKMIGSLRSKASVPLSMTFPVMLPVVPPFPSWSVPAVIVVPPV